jgi:two-component system, NtrC family, sensor kinase
MSYLRSALSRAVSRQRAQHLKFWPLWLASVAAPLFILAAAAWWLWNLELFEARSRMERTVDLLREQALRTFEIQDALLTAAQGYTAAMSWEEIATDRAVADFLRELDDGTRDISAIGIVAPGGRLLQHSKAHFPLPRTIDLSDRDYVVAQQGSSAGTYIGETLVGRVGGRVVFTYSRPHRGADGKPDGGVLWASFPPNGFSDFYATVAEIPADTVELVRNDGVLLVRYPSLPRATGYQLPPNSAPMQAVHAAARAAAFAMGQSPFDGEPHLYVARQLGSLPLSVIYGLHTDTLRHEWLRDLRVLVGTTAAAMALLLLMTWLVTHRARVEGEALERARAESELRAEAESALRRRQRLAILGQITAGVAHDFRNVVHSMQGGLDLVRQALETGDLTRANVVIDMVAEAAERGAGLTNRMLQVASQSGVSQQEATETRATFDPIAVVRTTIELLERSIGSKWTIRLQREPTGVPQKVRGEPAEFEVALLNLALNARDAMPSGGDILILIGQESINDSSPVNPEGLDPGHYARIAVRDAGVGMDATTLERATEAFFTTKTAAGGTGLGLSTAGTFARSVGGALRVASSGPNRGTTVTLWLPQVSLEPTDH